MKYKASASSDDLHAKPRLVETAILDLLAVVLFALLARIAHNTPEMPFSWTGVAETAWPFLLGTIVATAIVAFFGFVPGSFRAGAIVWIGTVAAGLLTWGLVHGEVPHWSFMIVASSVSAILILGWRGLARLGNRFAGKH